MHKTVSNSFYPPATRLPPIHVALSAGLLLATWGCAPSVDHLQAHIRVGAFDKAVANVSGDEAMERELAVLLIEDAAGRGMSSRDLVDDLSRAGKSGKRALIRLKRTGNDMVSELAAIALAGNDAPEAPDLVRWVHHDYADVRAACAKKWHATLELHILSRLILDHSPTVRLYAVRGLAQRSSDDVSEMLGEILRLDPVPRVRAEAAKMGSLLGADALRLLRTALDSNHLGVRLAAIQGLSEIGDADAVAILEDWASRPMSEETVAAAAELSRRKLGNGEQQFISAMEHEQATIRKAAMLRLERAKIKNRRNLIVARLKDDDPSVVLQAAHLLRKDEAARAKVIKALRSVSDGDSPHAPEGRDALARMGNPKAIKTVKDALLSSQTGDILPILKRVRGTPQLRPAFVRLLADDREAIRIEAARALLAS